MTVIRVELYRMVPHNATLLAEGQNEAALNGEVVANMSYRLLQWFNTKVQQPVQVNQKGCPNLPTRAISSVFDIEDFDTLSG